VRQRRLKAVSLENNRPAHRPQASIRKAMPTTVQTMIAGTAEQAAARGMRQALDETLGGFLRPQRIGFAVGVTTLAVGLSVRARRRRLERIEQKVDQLLADEPEHDF
jgi:hypothetical protein